jgi:hypothetical protein
MSFILLGDGKWSLEIKVLLVWSEKEEFGFEVKGRALTVIC